MPCHCCGCSCQDLPPWADRRCDYCRAPYQIDESDAYEYDRYCSEDCEESHLWDQFEY